MAKVNTNSFCRVSTVSSSFFPNTRETIVTVSDNNGHRYIGKAKWNKECDEFDPSEGFRIAYERALKQIPEENIIEKCGGLRDGDWVHMQSKDTDYETWGIVFHGNILYMMGSGNYDKVSVYTDGKGETAWDRITTIVRPIADFPITYDDIWNEEYDRNRNKDRCKVYTAD